MWSNETSLFSIVIEAIWTIILYGFVLIFSLRILKRILSDTYTIATRSFKKNK